jgi:hypothetical protein
MPVAVTPLKKLIGRAQNATPIIAASTPATDNHLLIDFMAPLRYLGATSVPSLLPLAPRQSLR